MQVNINADMIVLVAVSQGLDLEEKPAMNRDLRNAIH